MDNLAISPIYIAGHVNPDIDSIASAIGYAWLLQARDGKNAIAVRSGTLTSQAAWVLQLVGIEPPMLLTDASPRINRIVRPLPPILPDRPLHEALSIITSHSIGVPIVGSDDVPLGIVTGWTIFKLLSNQITHLVDFQNVSVATLLSIKCKQAMDDEVPRFSESTRISDARRRILKEERNDFIVTRDDGTYFGVCRTPDILNPPRIQIVLVDHNEASQSIRSLDEADLVEVIDHHRIGAQSTKTPVPFTIDCVGSTSTLIAERIALSGITPPPEIAAVLLAGVISDTLILTSPTTTERDRRIVAILMGLIAQSKVLPFQSYTAFGEALFSASSSFSVLTVDNIINTDLKLYEMGSTTFGLAQVEVGNLVELGSRAKELSNGLNDLCESKKLEFAILMVTDVVRSVSRLILGGNREILKDLPYTPLPDGTLEATGVVSRKKQLLPVVFGLVE